MTTVAVDKDLNFQKHRMRSRVKQLRSQLLVAQYSKWSEQICAQILGLGAVQKAQTIMLYRSVRNEADLDPLFSVFQRLGKKTVTPRVEGDAIRAYYTSDLSADFEIGYAGIREPLTTCEQVPLEKIDIVIVPGCAFDLLGHRLGWGRGFYDRFFQSGAMHTTKIAAAFNFQVVHAVPANDDDVGMDHLVTETRVLSF